MTLIFIINIIGHKAWEYKNEALITLCADCHKLEHENTETLVYTKSDEVMYIAERCEKCDGSGYLPQFNYYRNGVCFECGGHGVILK